MVGPRHYGLPYQFRSEVTTGWCWERPHYFQLSSNEEDDILHANVRRFESAMVDFTYTRFICREEFLWNQISNQRASDPEAKTT
ncbi:hypothetical protein AVEN_77385-1 [Araneus ventricosus]|uniref:Uncharacterized protein n=1 Tax=Araneus ventricosus TaxID=182803 RepID=A0A4Y2C8A7_ARAVE|nr:hypothetical protein AVEN_77385-1 [Araneus ventricosus]